MESPINILFLHSHNTGRTVQPYGHAVPTPNLQRLAEEGALFRNAYAAAPTCSPSRASFLSGMFSHSCGMLGLAHRGFPMSDYRYHIVQTLKENGYYTASAGVEHTAPDIMQIGYDAILSGHDTNYPEQSTKPNAIGGAINFLKERPSQPFFLSVGLNETHRPFPPAEPESYPAEDARYTLPVSPFPDHPITRNDTADFKAAARIMDDAFGAVLDALEQSGLAENTLVFCFSDHGLQFPQHMCNLTDRGMGVYLIIRGPGGFTGGQTVEKLVSLIDLVPTAYDVAGISMPEQIQGKSICALPNGEVDRLHEAVFAEVNYHAAYEPMRAVRTERHKYIRRYDGRDQLVLPNVDDTPSKEFLLDRGWLDEPREQEMLYDLLFDPHEMNNLIDEADLAATCEELRNKLDTWMRGTNDPLLECEVVPAPSGSKINDPDGYSPREVPLLVP